MSDHQRLRLFVSRRSGQWLEARAMVLAIAAAVTLAACGESPPPPAPAAPTAPPRPTGAATVSGLPTAAVTRDPYALPTSTPYGGVRATVTVTTTVTPSPVVPTASPSPSATAADATETPAASPTTDVTASPIATPSAGASPTATASPTPTVALPPTTVATPEADGGLALSVIPGRSSVAFRVNEQLAGKDLPGDAVGSTAAVSGVIAIGADGEIDEAQSRVVVDLNGLRSDNGMRDAYIRRNVLDVESFPNAVFVPLRAEGLPFPLPEAGAVTFRLTGTLTIHGTSREVTFNVAARRTGNEISGTANATITFADFGMEEPKVAAVLSVSEEIRLEVALLASVVR